MIILTAITLMLAFFSGVQLWIDTKNMKKEEEERNKAREQMHKQFEDWQKIPIEYRRITSMPWQTY